MQRPPEILTLKNGGQAERTDISMVVGYMLRLSKRDIHSFYALLDKARDPKSPVGPDVRWTRQQLALFRDNDLPKPVRDIVLSCVAGDYPDLKLVSPTND